MLKVRIEGMDALRASINGQAKQIPFAASKALNTLAFASNARIKDEMQSIFKGGATPFSLRSFKIDKAQKDRLTVEVSLREDVPDGGASYSKALRHLFTGGTRDWKKVEGYLRSAGLIPNGMMVVPGDACPLDSRGNMKKTALSELLGVVRSNIKNLSVLRKSGKGKSPKAIGYFVILSSDKTKLHPGIWKRITTGSSSGVKPIIMFVHPGKWRKFIDLQSIGRQVVDSSWKVEFSRELENAIKTEK